MESKKLDLFFSSSTSISASSRWWNEDTIAIVTGANKGIGFALAKRFAELGLTVILTARDVEKGQRAVESLRGFNVHFYKLDVSDPASIGSFVSWFKECFGKLDILINNAAVSFNDIDENSVEHAEMVIKTNFYGPKLLTEALLLLFRNSTSGSRILNISSRLGCINRVRNPNIRALLKSENLSVEHVESLVCLFLSDVKNGTWNDRGWPELWTDYAVSKLALNAYSKILAKRCDENGITVNCYCPGFTQTSMTRGKGSRTADDVAHIGARLALLPAELLKTGNFYTGSSPMIINSKL